MKQKKRLDKLIKVSIKTGIYLDILEELSKNLPQKQLETFCKNACNTSNWVKRKITRKNQEKLKWP